MEDLQGSHRDWKTWKTKVVLEKSWDMKNWPKVMEFCDQYGILPSNCTKFAHFSITETLNFHVFSDVFRKMSQKLN